MRYQNLRRATRATFRLPPLKNDDKSIVNNTEYNRNFSISKHYTSTRIMH